MINNKGALDLFDISISEVAITNGIVGWWPPTTQVTDISGNENTIILNGVEVTNYQGEQSFRFDAKSDYIRIDPIAGSTISASMWYFYETSGTWNTVFCRDGGSHHHVLIQTSTSLIGFYTGGSFHSSGFSLTPNTWHHIAVVKEGVNSRLYIDTDLKQNSGSSFDNNSWPLGVIGNYSSSNPLQGAIGAIRDVRIYDRALSPEEVGILYDMTALNGTMMKKTSTGLYIKGRFNEVTL